jgi:hypothetical protein
VEHPNFKAACLARGLLQDDYEWKQCLEEARHMQSGKQLRNLFIMILHECHPSRPEELWQTFSGYLCEDLRHFLQHRRTMPDATAADAIDYGLYLIWTTWKSSGGEPHKTDLPRPDFDKWRAMEINHQADQTFNPAEQSRLAEERIPMLNERQRAAFDAIKHSIENNAPKLYFLNGPAGTGKTFVYNTLTHYLRGKGKIVICVASSGIASQLLLEGRTAHSTFKIPLNVNEASVCSIDKQSSLANLLRQADCIVWDEIPMQHRFCQEAVDRTLRDIRNCDLPMGGITTVDGGDFQQILPVIIKGGRTETVLACIKKSPLWDQMHILHLTENKRLQGGTPEDHQFAQWLLQVGRGQGNDAETGLLQLPDSMKCGSTVEKLIDTIYPGINQLHPAGNNDEFFQNRTILSARNADVDQVNAQVLGMMRGDVQTFHSSDVMIREDGADQPGGVEYPAEYLNTFNASGVPQAKLQLKIGAPLMIYRNLDFKAGICNGTRVILTKISRRVLEVRVLGTNQTVFLPRIKFKPAETEVGFAFTRLQFPVRLAFSMTINKSQGQSVKKVGLDLRTPVFTHGQLYVALSRCTSQREIKVLLDESQMEKFQTQNIVYDDILLPTV